MCGEDHFQFIGEEVGQNGSSMKGIPTSQFLLGLSRAAGTDTKLITITINSSHSIQSWLSSLPPILLKCPYVIAETVKTEKGMRIAQRHTTTEEQMA